MPFLNTGVICPNVQHLGIVLVDIEYLNRLVNGQAIESIPSLIILIGILSQPIAFDEDSERTVF